ncbi:LysR family transcriptional regulator (fragment) [Agrobacterium tumefaciens str. B6]|uniref:LysR family transcriptional regulator n=1 Tax=Agrobacterium tumefaciens str. B6 TaxID=1183423 RepID=A0A822VC27_AGRTU
MLAADRPHRQWQMRDAARREEPGGCGTRWWSIILPQCAWALIGMGVTMIAKPDALSYLESADLTRVLPHWYADARADLDLLRQPYASAAKTRVFIDFVVEAFQREKWPERFAGSMG